MAQKESDRNKKRQRKAKGVILVFLKKLRATCGTFGKTEQWYGFIKKHLTPILEEYGDTLPAEILGRIKQAENVTAESREAIERSCRNLGRELETAAKMLPGGGSASTLAALIAAAIALGVAAAYLSQKAVTVVIRNSGCATINPVIYLPANIPGLSLPKDPIPSGGQGVAKLPPVSFTIDNSVANTVKLGALGINLTFKLESAGIDILFDGTSLLGRATKVSLAPNSKHTLTAHCR